MIKSENLVKTATIASGGVAQSKYTVLPYAPNRKGF